MSSMAKMGKSGVVRGMDSAPPLDRWRADAVLEPRHAIWGLASLAARMGLSVDTVRDLAARDDTPIYRPAGKYFAWSDELDAWLRSK